MGRPSLRWAINSIAYASHIQQIRDGPLPQTRRPTPSAGALHPIELLILWPGKRPALFLYDATLHDLHRLAVTSHQPLHDLIRDVRDLLPEGDGGLIILVGDGAKVAAAYERSQSLLWRDAGALLQTLNLTATAYGQAFCAMGVLGEPVLQAIEPPPATSALGMAMIGAMSDV
jgi:hypothetical protein